MFSQAAYPIESCPEDIGSTQQYICEANISYTKSADLLNSHYEQLLSIFEREIKADNHNANFKEMKSHLISSQAAWSEYIEAQCLYNNAIESSTSGAPALEYICKEEFSKERININLSDSIRWKLHLMQKEVKPIEIKRFQLA